MQSIRRLPNTAYSSHSLHSGDVMANEQTSVSRVADREELFDRTGANASTQRGDYRTGTNAIAAIVMLYVIHV
jgi:hypothetical protein